MTAFTPSEAETRLCPQMLFYVGSQVDPYPTECLCRGPRCMAWRWMRTDVVAADELRRHGYCGLAGAPEAA